MKSPILIVDDEQSFLNSVVRKLRILGYTDLTPISKPMEVLPLLEAKSFDAAFLDITMPEMDGLELLEKIKEHSPRTECIMVTADENIPSVINAIKLGAYDYLVKPIQPDQLVHALDLALERKRLFQFLELRREKYVDEAFETPEVFRDVITCDGNMIQILREAELHAQSEIVILITGETGVGKDLLAKAIHRASMRADGPFVAVNMLSLSGTLFESEFFGHVKGAFTGAHRDKPGYLDQARKGTLFLDEIGDLPMEIQGKLLRILQEKEFIPVGKTTPETSDVRFMAATNQDLEKLVAEGKFRKDLFYRLQYACLRLPPLRERRDDIRILAADFLEKASGPGIVMSEKAESMLIRHDWPGNIRELKGVMEAAANLARSGTILPEHLNIPVKTASQSLPDTKISHLIQKPLSEVEREHILLVYRALENNKTQAARSLGISLATLQRKLKSYNVK